MVRRERGGFHFVWRSLPDPTYVEYSELSSIVLQFSIFISIRILDPGSDFIKVDGNFSHEVTLMSLNIRH